jgi:hypothetical protein
MDLECIGEYAALFCTEEDLLMNRTENALIVSTRFVRSHPQISDYFFVLDEYSHDEIISMIGQNPMNPFKFLDKLEVFHSIHLKIQDFTQQLGDLKEMESVSTVLYQTIAIEEIVKSNEQKVEKFVKYKDALRHMFNF